MSLKLLQMGVGRRAPLQGQEMPGRLRPVEEAPGKGLPRGSQLVLSLSHLPRKEAAQPEEVGLTL